MKLISGKFTNFCQFRDRSISFSPGLTAILGKNGSGKTNLLNGLYSTITGDFSRNSGSKTDNICQLASPGESSGINVVLEHSDNLLDITRNLRPQTCRLAIKSLASSSETVITKISEVNDAVSNILGVTNKVLSDCIFIDQWSIFDFLSFLPSERAKAFQKLFKTDKAEQLWDAIGKHVDKIIIPTAGIDRDAINSRLVTDRVRLKELEDLIASLDTEIQTYDRLQLSDMVRDQLFAEEIAKDIRKLEDSVATYKLELSNLIDRKNRAKKSHDDNTASLNNLQQDIKNAQKAINAWGAYKANKEQINQVKTNLLRTSNNRLEQVKKEPVKPEYYVDQKSKEFEELRVYVEQTASKLNADEYMSGLMDKTDGCCPTCGTPRDQFDKYQPDYEKDLLERRKELDIKSKQMIDIMEYDGKIVVHNYYLDQIDSEMHFFEEELINIQVTNPPELPEQECKAVIDFFYKLTSEVSQAKNTIDTLDILVEDKTKLLRDMDVVIQPKKDLLKRVTVLDATANEAREKLFKLDDLTLQFSKATAEKNIVVRSISQDESKIKELEGIESVASVERSWIKYCQDMREVVHRDNLPKLVADNYLETIQDEINDLLLRFDSQFRVQTDQELSFTARFTDGRKVPASRLSGGEKVLLALAFRVAVNDLFTKNLGLLCLDEPTAGLDNDNLSCVKIALERLREMSSSSGLQVIVITHEKELSYLFDNVIEL